MPIPFKSDLLFNFFNKKTVVADTYLQDPISTLKLYPVKSPAVKPTIIQTGFKVSKTVLANAKKCVFVFHHKLADLVAGYLGFAKENLTAVVGDYYTFALYLNNGKTQYQFYHGTFRVATINTSALEDDNYYRVTAIWNGTNNSFKFQKVSRTNNAVTIGTAINSTVAVSGANIADIDLGILAANYSNGSVGNGAKAKICCMQFFDANDNCIVHIPFCEGTGNLATDVCNGITYTIANETDFTTFRNYTQDFSFYNFRYGFTLYQKSGSPDLRIPNKEDGTEITLPIIPSGYIRISNVKGSGLTWNGCESLVKLDDVSAGEAEHILVSGAGTAAANGKYFQDGSQNGHPQYKSSTGNILFFESFWKIAVESPLSVYYYDNLYTNVPTPIGLTMVPFAGSLPAPVISLAAASDASDIYTADVDHFLFTENTGVAKEFDMSLINMASISDRGYLYYNETLRQNFMLYATDKTLLNDVKIIKYIGMSSRISYDESGAANYDENNHVELTEV